MNNVKIHTDISVQDKYNAKTVYAPDPQIRENYEAFVQYVRELELRMRGYGKQENVIDGLIASYECYDYTNESDGREILTDLTGNGHDIQLYNFAFAESSGYGKYNWNFNTFKLNNAEHTSSKIIFNKESFPATFETWIVPNNGYISVDKIKGVTIKVSGIKTSTLNFYIVINTRDNNTYPIISNIIDINKDGIYTLQDVVIPENYNGNLDLCYYGFREINISANETVVIEQIPDYKGALVSDGVDDYGLCENFPIFTKEKGYTVCAIRKWLNIPSDNLVTFLSKRVDDNSWDGAFTIERIGSSFNTYNFGNNTNFYNTGVSYNTEFIYQTSKKYKDIPLSIGESYDTNKLILFCAIYNVYRNLSSIALYALEIYDRDLTDEEIAKVKERMIKRYEEKTGETYVEEVTA